MTRRCAKCGSELDDDIRFCTNCGAQLNAKPEAEVPAPQKGQGTAEAGDKKKRAIVIGAVMAVVVISVICIMAFAIARQSDMTDGATSVAGQTQDEASEDAIETSSEDLGFKGIANVRASSTLPTDSINIRDYSAASIMDGDEWTCWAENVPGPGINEYVAFSGDGEQTFHGFKIRNGHQYSIQLYFKNARATSLNIIVDGEIMETVPLEDEGLNWQTITFAKPYTGKEIALQINTAESGSSYDDCCIAEVEFF